MKQQINPLNKKLSPSGSEMFTTSTMGKVLINSPQNIPNDERDIRGDKILTSDFDDYQSFLQNKNQDSPSVEEVNFLRNNQSQPNLPSASKYMNQVKSSIYQYIVPVAQLNLSAQGSTQAATQAAESPMNRNLSTGSYQRQNKSQAQGAGAARFAALQMRETLLHKRDLSNQTRGNFAQIDSITNGPSSNDGSRRPQGLKFQDYAMTQRDATSRVPGIPGVPSKKLDKFLDIYQVRITLHSVQIEIPQSIKMVIQGLYTPQSYVSLSKPNKLLDAQAVTTQKKCRVEIIKTIDEKSLKIADFKDQEIVINVFEESEIKYSAKHMQELGSINPKKQQKCAIKLLAVSEDKQKLIGIINYNFNPSNFEDLKRKTVQFQKSIDKNASLCLSTKIQVVKKFSQNDYDSKFRKVDFSQADDMGNETFVTEEAPEDKTQVGEVAQTPRVEQSIKQNLTTNKKKGINTIINTGQNMKMRGPSSQIPLHPKKISPQKPSKSEYVASKAENSLTEVTIIHDEYGGLDQEREPITIYQPEEEDQTTDRDAQQYKKNLPRDSMKVSNEPKNKRQDLFSPGINDTIIQDQTLRYPGLDDPQPDEYNIKSTMNLFIEKLQVGVQKVIKENEPAIQNFKRSLSNNMPLSRYTRSAHEGQSNMRFANPKILRGDGIPFNDDYNGSLRNKSESTRPPYGQQACERPQNTMEKCLQNEIDALKQEKIFVQQRLEQVQEQSQEQIRVLQEKLAEKEIKYAKKKQSIDEMKAMLEDQMQNYIEVQKQNENEFKDEYEYMIHLYNRQHEFKELFENKFIQEVKEKEQIQIQHKDEILKLKQQFEDEKDEMIKQYLEEKDANKDKDWVQVQEIEALTNEIEQKDKQVKEQTKQIDQKDQTILQLQKQVEELLNYKKESENLIQNSKDLSSQNLCQLQKINDLEDQQFELEDQLKQAKADCLKKDKEILKIKSDSDSLQKIHIQQSQELQKTIASRDEQKEQIQEMNQRLRFTEAQLITVKSSWAESEHEREQLFNQLQDQEEQISALQEQVKSYNEALQQ